MDKDYDFIKTLDFAPRPQESLHDIAKSLGGIRTDLTRIRELLESRP